MNCAVCCEKFNDGVQCSLCKKHLDFGCANISESTYRRMKAEKRAAWRCSSCQAGSSASSQSSARTPEPASLDKIMEKLNSMELKLVDLPKLISDIKGIKGNITNLQDSCQGAINRIEEFASRIEDVEARVTCLEASLSDIVEVKSQIFTCLRNDMTRDQLSRLNNIEIKGVPFKKSENLFDIIEKLGVSINYKVAKVQINYVSRIPTYSGNEKSIVVSFLNRYVKEDFVASARLLKSLSAADIGFKNDQGRIYVNDHLSPEYKKLLTRTKQRAKEKSYQFTWVKFSKIHVRKNDASHVITIKSESDLNKLV